MSKMLRLELVGIVLLACTQILTENRDFYGPYHQYGHQRHGGSLRQEWEDDTMIKEVQVKEGLLRGMVLRPTTNQQLPMVDVFLGIPYAEPPVGSFRFSPPRSPQPWRYVRKAQEFAPVCPQVLPNLRLEVKPGRHEYLEKLLPYLRNQSEDCLYLNIYAPHQNDGRGNPRQYPVMVFIQGESFEWNSGNPYDGTVISAYGNVVFVTLNFRLGILGFLRPGTNDDTVSNFGLLDQTAALLWLRDNIAKFGGDPDSVTLVGHGTGAIFANLLLISPVANNKGLFRRAILMSGSALSSDAIGKAPLQITKQVAHALNCPTTNDNDLAQCLRNRDLDSLLNVKIAKPRYVPAYAPLIDRTVIPIKPLALMENSHLFGRFDLMYGVTESEKYHLLSPIDALHGMLDQERNSVLRDHAKASHELEPDLALSKILERYADFREGYAGEYTMKNRDLVLDALSDSGTVAPLVTVADLHSRANPKSYMYVFSHSKGMRDYSGQQKQRTVHGEELPYVLGIPLDGGRYQLRERYNLAETLFSEAMMTWWCNFAYTGNPNIPRRLTYMNGSPEEGMQYKIDWPEYNSMNRTYFNLTIPPNVGEKYRAGMMQFWTDDLPNLIRHRPTATRTSPATHPENMTNYSSHGRSTTEPGPSTDDQDPSVPHKPITGSINATSDSPDTNTMRGSSAITMVIGFGVVFLLINVTAFVYLYHRRHALKNKEKKFRRRATNEIEGEATKRINSDKLNIKQADKITEIGQKSDSKVDLNALIKNDKAYDNNSNFGRRSKLSRDNSTSTIDTHIKVKEWIQQEIVHRCSPRFLRKTRETLQKEHQEKMTRQQEIEDDEERRRYEEEKLRETKAMPIYEQNPALVVRPGKKSKLPKVSVAVDATPATRTESILKQTPIELVKNMEMINELGPYEPKASEPSAKPQVVVIEHHHSRSDPLPMETVFKCVKPNYSTTQIYESDSGSASSLYAKINPKMKARLQRPNHQIPETPEDEIYGTILTKLATFSPGEEIADINVTCREPMSERQMISPEEALNTIRRRNYPKVLPDIEKRRSLPAPNSLFISKVYGTLTKDHRPGAGFPAAAGQPPPPPPRMFGTSKSLDLPEEIEEKITTNLHVGPLLKRQDSYPGSSPDPSLIDSFQRVAKDAQQVLSSNRIEYADAQSTRNISPNPMCPLHGGSLGFGQPSIETSTSQSVDGLDRSIGNPNWYRNKEPSIAVSKGNGNSSLPDIIGNPVWCTPLIVPKDNTDVKLVDNEPTTSMENLDHDKCHITTEMKNPADPRIIITPRVGNLLGQSGQNLVQTSTCATTMRDILPEVKVMIASKPQTDHFLTINRAKLNQHRQAPPSTTEHEDKGSSFNAAHEALNTSQDERNEPKIVITPKDPRNPMIGSNVKQPKIIIKPTTNMSKNREHKNIPKVSAIPSPEVHNLNNYEKDSKGPQQPHEERLEKPPIKDKPNVIRKPSFSRRKDKHSGYNHIKTPNQQRDKTDVHQLGPLPVTSANKPTSNFERSDIACLTIRDSDTSPTTSSANNSNTNTIKRKPQHKT